MDLSPIDEVCPIGCKKVQVCDKLQKSRHVRSKSSSKNHLQSRPEAVKDRDDLFPVSGRQIIGKFFEMQHVHPYALVQHGRMRVSELLKAAFTHDSGRWQVAGDDEGFNAM